MQPHDSDAPMLNRLQPERADVAGNARLTVVNNALATSLMSVVRDGTTGTERFGALAGELAKLVLWEACRDLALVSQPVMGFAGQEIAASRLADRVGGVVILRAGLLFARPFRELFAEAGLFQIGVRRDEVTLEASVYTCNIPGDTGWADRVLVFDPMLATGGSVLKAIQLIRGNHEGPIDVLALIAAPVGVHTVLEADDNGTVYCAALDERLDEHGFIVPGLGDAGDRLFGTT